MTPLGWVLFVVLIEIVGLDEDAQAVLFSCRRCSGRGQKISAELTDIRWRLLRISMPWSTEYVDVPYLQHTVPPYNYLPLSPSAHDSQVSFKAPYLHRPC